MTSLKSLGLSLAVLLCGMGMTAPQSAFAASNNPAPSSTGAPSGLRSEAAYNLLSRYIKDAVGKAEITTAPRQVAEAPPTYRLMVRYLSKPAAQSIFGSAQDEVRCIRIESGPADAEGKFRFSIETLSANNSLCRTDEKFGPYHELEKMAARVRDCERKGEARCLVSEPSSNNRRILVLH